MDMSLRRAALSYGRDPIPQPLPEVGGESARLSPPRPAHSSAAALAARTHPNRLYPPLDTASRWPAPHPPGRRCAGRALPPAPSPPRCARAAARPRHRLVSRHSRAPANQRRRRHAGVGPRLGGERLRAGGWGAARCLGLGHPARRGRRIDPCSQPQADGRPRARATAREIRKLRWGLRWRWRAAGTRGGGVQHKPSRTCKGMPSRIFLFRLRRPMQEGSEAESFSQTTEHGHLQTRQTKTHNFCLPPVAPSLAGPYI